jgi:hypothetical protein
MKTLLRTVFWSIVETVFYSVVVISFILMLAFIAVYSENFYEWIYNYLKAG